MKKFLGILMVLFLAASCAPAAPPVQGKFTLVEYVDDGYGIKTVIPEGWHPRSSGVVWRKSSATDMTLIVQQSDIKSTGDLWVSLLPRLHLSEVPESVGKYQGKALEWTLYRVNVSMMAAEVIVDLALARTNGKSYFVFLQTLPQEQNSLYESIFVPTLDAFTPLDLEEAPAPYNIEEVTFQNGDVTLAGTLTLPRGAGPHPAVVLVTGSGPQDRDDAISGIAIKPFRLIADALSREGMAVLRYDDRGVGSSTGDFLTATLADFAADASAAVEYLRHREEIDSSQIGLLGHSEGGLVAAMLGARNNQLAFIIVMAGPSINGRDIMIQQTRQRMETDKASQEEIDVELAFVQALADTVDNPAAMEKIAYQRVLEQTRALPEDRRAEIGDVERYAHDIARLIAQEYSAGWFKSFLEYDPAADLAQTTIPVLAIYGSMDIQVDAEQNAPAMEAALKAAGNPDFQVFVLPGANHVFQKAETGSFAEISSLPAEFMPEFLTTLQNWLKAHIVKKN